MDFLKEIKQGITKIKDKLTKTELQRLLKEATSNEHCHANVSLLDEISSKTHNYNDFRVIVSHCLKKLDCNKEKWRKILKTLFLIEHILKTGSPNFYDSMRNDISKVKYLHSFSFVDTSKSDKGETIREKSRVIVDLLENKNKLKQERENYSKWKSRIEGVSSSGKMSSTSYDPYSNSISSSNYSNTYAGESKKRRDSPIISSSSSEDEKNNKKKDKKDKKKNKKQSSDSDDQGSDEDNSKNIKNKRIETESTPSTGASLKTTANFSLKKPSSSNRQAENESLFQMQQGINSNTTSNNTPNLVNIEDLLGGSGQNNIQAGNNHNGQISNTHINTNSNANQNNLNLIDFSFINNNQTVQNQNVGQNNLFDIGSNPPIQSNFQQQPKTSMDDLFKNMYSNNTNNTNTNQNINFQNMHFNNMNNNFGFNSAPQINNGFNNFNNFNSNPNGNSSWGYNQNNINNMNFNFNNNLNQGFTGVNNNSSNYNFNFSGSNNKKQDDDEFCEVVEEESKNGKNINGKTDIMSLLNGIGNEKRTNNNPSNNNKPINNANNNFNFY